MQSDTGRQPLFNAPGVVVAVLAVLAVMHGGRQLLGQETDHQVLVYLAFFPLRFSELGAELPGGTVAAYTSLFTHALLHVDWVHLLINGAWLLAFGSLIARRMNAVCFIILFAVCAAAGALAYLAFNGFQRIAVIGASGAVSGLMGASFRLIFSFADGGGLRVLQEHPDLVPRMPLSVVLTNSRVLGAVAVWVAVNLVFGYVFPGVLAAGGIAWEAHLGGFFAGFLLFDLFDQGRGWRTPTALTDAPVA